LRAGRRVPDNRGMPDPTALPVATTVTVYGADWCGDCRRTKRWLEASGIEWEYIDRDADPAVRAMLAEAGYLAIPVVVLPGGNVLVEPSDAALARAVGAVA
jgi:mycoredoxin